MKADRGSWTEAFLAVGILLGVMGTPVLIGVIASQAFDLGVWGAISGMVVGMGLIVGLLAVLTSPRAPWNRSEEADRE